MIQNKLSELGIRLKNHHTGEHRALCPKCSHMRKNKTDPCLAVKIDPDGEIVFTCHHCGWAGNTTQKKQSIVRTKMVSRPPPEPDPQKPESMYNWFSNRKISKETVDKIGCYVTERNGERCIVFPYFLNGELVNRKYRTADKKFSQDPGAERTIFNIDSIEGDTVVFVEGEMDVLACIEAGITNVITLPDGAPPKPKEEIDPDDKRFAALHTCESNLEGINKFILATDSDAPGKALAEELARRLGRENCWIVEWPSINDVPRKDANEVLIEDGPNVLKECIENAQPYPISGLHSVDKFSPDVWEIYNGKREPGLSTGWESLDKFMRIRGGDMTIVTGTPGSGKTEFIDALMMNLSRLHGWKFVLCSFENQADEHIGKLAEKYIHAPFWEGPTQRMDEGMVKAALQWLRERFYFIRADDESPTIDWIIERATAAVRRHGVRGLVIDPYNEIEHKIPPGMTETSYISLILGKLRRWAKNHGSHVWFIAHPAKMYREKSSGKMPVPNLYDISGSAAWSAKADFGIVVHRPDFDDPKTEIRILKVRHKYLGQLGTVTLRYAKATGEYFDDLEILQEPD